MMIKKCRLLYVATCIILFMCACAAKNNKSQNIAQENVNTDSSLQYLIREGNIKKDHTVLLILLHGYGADKNDLFPLAETFPSNYIVVTPQAPYQIGSNNYQWYTGIKDEKGNPEANAKELDSSTDKVEKLITRLQAKYHIPSSRTFLAGFSQGANMSYTIGLQNPDLLMGIGVLSGDIFETLKRKLSKEKASSLSIFIGHGNQDDRISYILALASKKWLDTHYYREEFHTYKGMSHAISPEEVNDFALFMEKLIANE